MLNPVVPEWSLLYTRPKQEKKVVEKLEEMNISSYLPLVKSVRQWHDRRKVVEAPLFPSYVFVNPSNKTELYKAGVVDGVVSYVRFGNEIAKVNQSIISNIQLAVDVCKSVEVNSHTFMPGQRLVVQGGPLSGFDCEMVDFNGKQKALVRIKLLNRSLLVDIPLHLITICCAC